MSLESKLERLADIFDRYVSILEKGGVTTPAAPKEEPAQEETPKKPAKKKAAKAKPAESTEEKEETPKKSGVDRSKVLGGIVEFIKEQITTAEDSDAVKAKVTEIREKYGVELVGDLADDQLEAFDTDIRAALS